MPDAPQHLSADTVGMVEIGKCVGSLPRVFYLHPSTMHVYWRSYNFLNCAGYIRDFIRGDERGIWPGMKWSEAGITILREYYANDPNWRTFQWQSRGYDDVRIA
jgi:hypothetical protein